GLADQAYRLAGTNATDTGALVPANLAPRLVFLSANRDVTDPFVHLFPGTTLRFDGAGADPEDGALPVTWSLDGTTLGTGNSSTSTAPAAGVHVLVARVTDTQGATSDVAVPFTALRPNAAPSIDGFAFGPCSNGAPTAQAAQVRIGQELCLAASGSD